jgi:hypothetical protein
MTSKVKRGSAFFFVVFTFDLGYVGSDALDEAECYADGDDGDLARQIETLHRGSFRTRSTLSYEQGQPAILIVLVTYSWSSSRKPP